MYKIKNNLCKQLSRADNSHLEPPRRALPDAHAPGSSSPDCATIEKQRRPSSLTNRSQKTTHRDQPLPPLLTPRTGLHLWACRAACVYPAAELAAGRRGGGWQLPGLGLLLCDVKQQKEIPANKIQNNFGCSFAESVARSLQSSLRFGLMAPRSRGSGAGRPQESESLRSPGAWVSCPRPRRVKRTFR